MSLPVSRTSIQKRKRYSVEPQQVRILAVVGADDHQRDLQRRGPVTQKALRSLRDVLVIGLAWGILWAKVGTSIGLVIWAVDPDSIGPGESPLVIGPLIGLMGLFSGIAFAVLLSLFERGKTALDLSVIRAALWGILASGIVGSLVVLPGHVARGDLGQTAAIKMGHFLVFAVVLTPVWLVTARWWERRRARVRSTG